MNFVQAYCDPKSETHLIATDSYLKAYGNKSRHQASNKSYVKMKKPEIIKTMRDLLNKTSLKEKIMKRMEQEIENPTNIRSFHMAAEYITKVTGDFAPEKHVNMNLDPIQREAFYNKVMEKVGQVAAGQQIVEPEPNTDVIYHEPDQDPEAA